MDCSDKNLEVDKYLEDLSNQIEISSDERKVQPLLELINQAELKQKDDNDSYKNKLPYPQYDCKQKDQNISNMQQNNASICSIDSEIKSLISDTNQENVCQQFQKNLLIEQENVSSLEEEDLKKIDKINSTSLTNMQNEIKLTSVKNIRLNDQIEDVPQIINQQTQNQNIQPQKSAQIQEEEENKQDFLDKSNDIQMNKEIQNIILLNQTNNFQDESKMQSQSPSFYQRENDQVQQNENSNEVTQTQGMDPKEALELIQSKLSYLQVELSKKFNINESLIKKIQKMYIDGSLSMNEIQKQINQIELRVFEIFNEFDKLDEKFTELSKQQNQNSNSKLQIESQSKYNQNINSKRDISQLENNFDIQNEDNTTQSFNNNIQKVIPSHKDILNELNLPDQNSQGVIMHNKQQIAESYYLDLEKQTHSNNENNNCITIYDSKRELVKNKFIEYRSQDLCLCYLSYNLDSESDLKIYSSDLYNIQKKQKCAYQFLFQCIINEDMYDSKEFSQKENNYLKKFASVLKEYLLLRNMQITKIYLQQSIDENINSLFVTSSNENEVLITELYLRDAEAQYKLLVDYQGFYLGKIREQQSLQEGLSSQKKVRLCLLPLRKIRFYEFEEQHIKQLQKDQTKDLIFRRSMLKWFSNNNKFFQIVNNLTEGFNGKQINLKKFVDSIIEECDQKYIKKYYLLDNSENILASNDCIDAEAIQKGIDNFKKYYFIHILLCKKLQESDIPPQVQQIVNELEQVENINFNKISQNNNQHQTHPIDLLNQEPSKKFKSNNYN
ncbi:hypothetical protein TTHERM_00079120 (macronuclear) [Tetrahymena thermophila SB210]|uniref:Uncharacterized protein n=1 Tax=Tetrahymena thermophila (strain SB210) TaxID=312017 RepID=Q23FV2_TETTS|nr:hypothetical protein TTHERM_00079120 [Tetrahymena thermophila SB210]EAR95508.1 hypothetical protein TTHERM_00079120 [Tetrahymena thermophila SB210]|eukprot:XP_001015753.1 hypothetical protein TTHERM_00079120 [Tetrahymena thermophila SB210]